MSVIPYIVSRGSSSVEKFVFAASLGIASMKILAEFRLGGLDSEIFTKFRPSDLIRYSETGYDFQTTFILFTLVCALIIYTCDPFERVLAFLLEEYKIKSVFKFRLKNININTVKIELGVVNNEFLKVVSQLYMTIILQINFFTSRGEP